MILPPPGAGDGPAAGDAAAARRGMDDDKRKGRSATVCLAPLPVTNAKEAVYRKDETQSVMCIHLILANWPSS